MAIFQSLDSAASGVNLAQTWLDAIAHNIANVNTVTRTDEEPFRAQLVRAQEAEGIDAVGEGVTVVSIDRLDGDPPLAYDPMHPLADENGHIQLAHVDLPAQMADLVLASRTYQVNVSVIESSKEAYEAAMRIGRR